MPKVPFPPFDDRPLPAKIGYGMDAGQTRRTGNAVVHTMVGTLWGTDAYFRRADVAAATHWGIGGALDPPEHDGRIIRWLRNGEQNLIPWASGPWRPPGYGDGPAYVNEFGQYGINAYADSIELSGMVDTPVTVKQWRSLVWLVAAILHDAGRDSESVWWNMHHREFCQPSYKDCPFPRVTAHTADYQGAVYELMRGYEGYDAKPAYRIAGLTVPLPIGAAQQPPDPQPPTPGAIFHAFDPHEVVTLRNAAGRQYGNTKSPVVRTYREGDTVTLVGYYHGEWVGGSDRWYVVKSDDHERIHESGLLDWKG